MHAYQMPTVVQALSCMLGIWVWINPDLQMFKDNYRVSIIQYIKIQHTWGRNKTKCKAQKRSVLLVGATNKH